MNKFIFISAILHIAFSIFLIVFSFVNTTKINIDNSTYIDIVFENESNENNEKNAIINNIKKPLPVKNTIKKQYDNKTNNKLKDKKTSKNEYKKSKPQTINEDKKTSKNEDKKLKTQTIVNNFIIVDKANITQSNSSNIIDKNSDEFKNFEKFLNETNFTEDILEDNNMLNQNEKYILSNQIKKCWISSQYIKDKTIEIVINFTMNEDRTIKNFNIKVLNIDNINEINSIQNNLNKIFSNTSCKELLLPKDKFLSWKNFSIKLNLKGFF